MNRCRFFGSGFAFSFLPVMAPKHFPVNVSYIFALLIHLARGHV